MNFLKVKELTKGVNALLCEKDEEALYRYASKVKNGGLIVDIGTAAGGSAFIMALASKPDVSVITIDPVVNINFILDRGKLGLDRKITFINETSKSAFRSWNSKKIDMLFIDGVHNYDGVMNDFNTFGSMVNFGGIIAIHDIFLYENTIGKAVKDLVNTNKIKLIEIIDDLYKAEKRVGMFIGEKI